MSDFDRFDYPRHDPWSNSSSSSQWTGSSHWDHYHRDHWRELDQMARLEPPRDHVVINPATGLQMHGPYGTGFDSSGCSYGYAPSQSSEDFGRYRPISPRAERVLKWIIFGAHIVAWPVVTAVMIYHWR